VPPVVEVDGGVVAVFVLADVSESVLVSPARPVWPPPVGVVVSPLESEESEPEFELELESEPELVDVDVVDELVPVDLASGGEATPVVGTVRGGAPLVSLEPAPLPPQAATTTATASAAQAETSAR
jgi:hypothetical protein